MASLRPPPLFRRSPAVRRIHRWYRWRVRGRAEVRRAAAELSASGDELAGTLALALEASAAGALSPGEQGWITRIERLRGRLAASGEEVTFTDFGVGAPGDEPAPEDVGRVRTRTVGELCMSSSNTKYTDRMMLKLIRALRPASCVEMGTCLGLSGAYQAAALELNEHGRIATLDGAAALVAIASRHFAELGLRRIDTVVGPFADTLDEAMRKGAPVDFAFVDGHHDGEAIVRYFDVMLQHLAPGAVLVFDDVTASADMLHGWAVIKQHAAVAGSVEIDATGMCWIRGAA